MRLELMLSGRTTADNISEADREDEMLDILQGIGSIDAPWIDRVQAVRSWLYDTPSSMIRGYAALALVDLGWRNAAEDILEVLRRPGIVEQSGTLFFALNEIGAALPLDIVAAAARDGSYEAQSEVMAAIEANRVVPFDKETGERLVAVVEPLLEKTETPAAEFAERLLAYIGKENLKAPPLQSNR